MNESALRALALGQLSGLLSAGLDLATATERLAQRLPDSDVKEDFARAAWTVAGGGDPYTALAAAVPAWLAPVFHSREGASIESRIALVAEHARRVERLHSRVRSMARYPVALAIGSAITVLVIGVGSLVVRQALATAAGGPSPRTVFQLAVIVAGLLAMASALALALRAKRQDTAPGWAEFVPGGRLFKTARVARFVALLATYLDPRGGATTAAVAVQQAGEAAPHVIRLGRARSVLEAGSSLANALKVGGLPRRELQLIRLGELSGKTGAGLHRALQVLEAQMAREVRLFVSACGAILLASGGLAVIVLWMALTLVVSPGAMPI